MPDIKNFRKGWTGTGGAGGTDEWMSVNAKNCILPVVRKIRDAMSGGNYASIPHYVGLEPMTFTIISPSDLGDTVTPNGDGEYEFVVVEDATSYNAGKFTYAAKKLTTHTLTCVKAMGDGGTLDHRAQETLGTLEFDVIAYKKQLAGATAEYDIDIPSGKFDEYGANMFGV